MERESARFLCRRRGQEKNERQAGVWSYHFNFVELFSLDHLLLVILDLLRELLDLRVNFLVQNNDVLLFLGQLAL